MRKGGGNETVLQLGNTNFTYVLCSLCVHTMKGRMEYICHPNTSEGDTGSKLTK